MSEVINDDWGEEPRVDDNGWIDFGDDDAVWGAFEADFGGMPEAEEAKEEPEAETEADKIEETEENKSLVGLSYQEKAARLNYYQDEKGVWREKNDFSDWADEEVSGFLLDVEYPELADRTEALAEQFGNRFDDTHGLKLAIYERADELSKASDEHLEAMMALNAFVGDDLITNEKLTSYDEEALVELSTIISTINAESRERQTDRLAERQVARTADYLINNYYEHMDEGDFVEKVAEHCTDYRIDYDMRVGLKGFKDNEVSGALFGDYLDYAKELNVEQKMAGKYMKYEQLLSSYVCGHGMREDTIDGFRNVVFPAIESGDPSLDCLRQGGNIFSTERYSWGIGDYTEQCLLSRYQPSDIDLLKRAYGEMPTSDFAKFEQNRRDACRLQEVIIGGRDFIHDERPGTHTVLAAIEAYYDHKDDEDAEKYRAKLEELSQQYPYGFYENALKLDRYDQPVTNLAKHEHGSIADESETAIDILRRLVKNTEPNPIETPKTNDEGLNDLLAKIDPIINAETGAVKVDLSEVGPAVSYMNELIRNNLGKQGIHPTIAEAISYLDKMSAFAVRGFEEKKIPEIAFDPQFKEIVRFAQLTSSTGYSEPAFEAKYAEIIRKSSEAYGGDSINTDMARDAMTGLHQWIAGNSGDLAKKYASKEATKRFSDAVWSGNLNDELIGLRERI